MTAILKKYGVILVLALAGCGGGGSSANSSTPTLCFGVGNRAQWMTSATTPVPTQNFLQQFGFPANNTLLGVWLGPGWSAQSLLNVQTAMNAGYVPVLMYWKLGDLSTHANAWAYVQSRQQAWLDDAQKIGQQLAMLKGRVLIVIQPEWNIPTLQDNAQFGQLLAQVAQTIHTAAGNNHGALAVQIGTAVGDFGDYTLTQDPSWNSFDPALKAAVPSLDFVGFQEMRAAQHFSGGAPGQGTMTTYTAVDEGISLMPARILALTQYLHQTYSKPVFLAYLTISTYTPANSTEDWKQFSATTTRGILNEAPQLSKAGLFGMMSMMLFDDPTHNSNGLNYFGDASDFFGLVHSASTSTQPPPIMIPPYTIKAVGQAWITGTAQFAGSCALPPLDQPQQPIGLLIPAYFDPTSDPGDWKTLTQVAGRIRTAVIMNPNNGPGSAPNPAYRQVVKAIQNAGGRVLGYIDTGYASQTISTLLAQAEDYRSWYGVDGFFLDDMATGQLSYYRDLSSQIRANYPNTMIVGNPGTIFDQSYIGAHVADVFVDEEADAATVNANAQAGWVKSYPSGLFAEIAYGAQSDPAEVQTLADRHIAWVYSTTRSLTANPYAALPADLSATVTQLLALP